MAKGAARAARSGAVDVNRAPMYTYPARRIALTTRTNG
jgi:hypothetical protein